MSGQLAIVLLTGACSMAVGLTAVLARPLLSRVSIRYAFAAVAGVALLGSVIGVVMAAEAMFLSEQDSRLVLVVAVVTGLVSLAFAMVLVRPVISGSRGLRDAARDLGLHGTFVPPPQALSTELREVSDELLGAALRLGEARERQRAMERARSELIVWLSHDLRTPLAGVRAMAEALEDGIDDASQRYPKQIQAEIGKVTDLVDALFALSRINAAALRLDRTTVALTDLVSDALAAAEPLASTRLVDLAGDAEPGLQVQVDAREMGRVLGNLLDNAIRHTGPDGTVVVTAAGDGADAVIAVRDECGGIREQDLDRVFEVAWRGNDARTPAARGHGGIGLAIVRGIVEAHGGQVSVANLDAGCRFEVRLPTRLSERRLAPVRKP